MGQAGDAFGPFVLDRGSGQLRRDGNPIAVGQRGLALLETLLDVEGVVSKAALMERGWPGTIVEEGNLTVQVAALRKALGTRADGQEWIATVPRVGYRLVRAQAGAPAAVAEAEPSGIPSLAVLPFRNMSGDPEQDYFADGFVEDVTTALSRFKSLAVVARNSSFVYKGRAVDVRQVARELGVRYVLEGSVRRAGSRLRITAQLIDGGSGGHLWADRFDGTVEDVFDFQDRITGSVVSLIEPQIRKAEIERARRKRPGSLDAYELYLQAMPGIYAMRSEENSSAIELMERSVALDPSFAPAMAMAGFGHMLRFNMQLPGATEADRARGLELAEKALKIAGDDASVLANCAFLLLQLGQDYDTALGLLRRAAAENPNDVSILTSAGIGNLLGGDLTEGAQYLERALGLNPSGFGTHWQLTGMAHIRMAEGRFEEALEWATRSQGVNRGYDATHWMLIAANAHLGHMEEARRHLVRLQTISPGVTLARIRRGQDAARDPHRIEVLIEGMRRAGMPEG